MLSGTQREREVAGPRSGVQDDVQEIESRQRDPDQGGSSGANAARRSDAVDA